MHVFHDSTLNIWKLITEKLPEKPRQKDYESGGDPPIMPAYVDPHYYDELEIYNAVIAALKQNALTVQNPEAIESTIDIERYPHTTAHGLFGREIELGDYIPDKLYFWPGGYETKEVLSEGWVPSYNDPDNSGLQPSAEPITVAILTLPEEKKNTMENLTKEQANKVLKLIEQAYRKGIFDCKDCNQSNAAINAHLIVSQVTAFELFKQFSLYRDHPTTSSGSVASPKEDGSIICEVCKSRTALHSTNSEFLCYVCFAKRRDSELAPLRQQLKEQDDLMKELAEELKMIYEVVKHQYLWGGIPSASFVDSIELLIQKAKPYKK